MNVGIISMILDIFSYILSSDNNLINLKMYCPFKLVLKASTIIFRLIKLL